MLSFHQSPSPSPAWYSLRRTLPTWSFQENLDELRQVLPRYRVDEVIVKVDTEEFSHGHPPLSWARMYQKNLFAIREVLNKMDIVYSLNPWITVGHNDRGRDSRCQIPGLRTVVGHNGTECTVCACPLSPAWREYEAELWTLYAETLPAVVWVEDDIRTFNHHPVSYGCFCPLHMQRFSQRVGQNVEREELIQAMLAPGEPHPWRRIYLEMQSEIMADTVQFLAQTIHRTSPETAMGLMSSGPRNHCLEARNWDTFSAALADGTPLYSRPPMGNYHEASLRGLYYSHDSIKLTRFCMPKGTIEQTEVENVPFTQYSKSAVFTFLEMAISFAWGSHGVTMNLFDHCGTPMEAEKTFGAMLGEKKSFLEGLATRAQTPGTYCGVRLLHHPDASKVKHLPPHAAYGQLAEAGGSAMEELEALGIPTTYEFADNAPEVCSAIGQTLRALDDTVIRQLLSKGLLLDAVAAGVLCERGFAEQIGIRHFQPPRHLDELGAFSAEEFFNPNFGGARQKLLTLTLPNLGGRPHVARLQLHPQAEIISRMVDPDLQPGEPLMFAFENEWGGRIIVRAMDLDTAFCVPYLHPFRRDQLQHAVRWLAHGTPELIVNGGVYPLAFRKNCDDFTLLGLFNLSLDPWTDAHFELAAAQPPTRIEVLTATGKWQTTEAEFFLENNLLSLNWTADIPFQHPLFLTLHWAD